jgi:hypothetical protein
MFSPFSLRNDVEQRIVNASRIFSDVVGMAWGRIASPVHVRFLSFPHDLIVVGSIRSFYPVMRRDRRLRERFDFANEDHAVVFQHRFDFLDRTSRLAEQIEKRDERRNVEHVA